MRYIYSIIGLFNFGFMVGVIQITKGTIGFVDGFVILVSSVMWPFTLGVFVAAWLKT